MKKRNLKTIKLNKQIVSILNTDSINGGLRRIPLDANGSEVSYCNAGTNRVCCA